MKSLILLTLTWACLSISPTALAQTPRTFRVRLQKYLDGFPVVALTHTARPTELFLLKASAYADPRVRIAMATMETGTLYALSGHVYEAATNSAYQQYFGQPVRSMIVDLMSPLKSRGALMTGPARAPRLSEAAIIALEVARLRQDLGRPRFRDRQTREALYDMRTRVVVGILVSEYPTLRDLRRKPRMQEAFADLVDATVWFWSQPGPDTLPELIGYIADHLEPRHLDVPANPVYCELELVKRAEFSDPPPEIETEAAQRRRLAGAFEILRRGL